jgi:hypothetical protein
MSAAGRFFSAVIDVGVRPAAFFRRLEPAAGHAEAAYFAAAANVAGTVAWAVTVVAASRLFGYDLADLTPVRAVSLAAGADDLLVPAWTFLAAWVGLSPLGGPLGVLLAGLLFHPLLRLGRWPHGFPTTFRVVAYASLVQTASLVLMPLGGLAGALAAGRLGFDLGVTAAGGVVTVWVIVALVAGVREMRPVS